MQALAYPPDCQNSWPTRELHDSGAFADVWGARPGSPHRKHDCVMIGLHRIAFNRENSTKTARSHSKATSRNRSAGHSCSKKSARHRHASRDHKAAGERNNEQQTNKQFEARGSQTQSAQKADEDVAQPAGEIEREQDEGSESGCGRG